MQSVPNITNRIGDVMINRLTASAVDSSFEPWLDQTKNYKIGICCFSAKHAKYGLAQNQDNVSKWIEMSTL